MAQPMLKKDDDRDDEGNANLLHSNHVTGQIRFFFSPIHYSFSFSFSFRSQMHGCEIANYNRSMVKSDWGSAIVLASN